LLKPRKTRDLKIERFASRDSLLIYVYVMYIYVYWIYKQIHTHPIVRPIVFLVQKKQSSRPPYHICSQPILLEHSPNCMSWFEYFWIRNFFVFDYDWFPLLFIPPILHGVEWFLVCDVIH
jgi:hypothetical protein